jgi:hypothetical protein
LFEHDLSRKPVPTFRDHALGALFTAIFLMILAGCATSPKPFSIEEKLWFDNASGAEFNGIETEGHKREGP